MYVKVTKLRLTCSLCGIFQKFLYTLYVRESKWNSTWIIVHSRMNDSSWEVQSQRESIKSDVWLTVHRNSVWIRKTN